MAYYFYSPRDIPTLTAPPNTTVRYASSFVSTLGSSETCGTFQPRAIRLYRWPPTSGLYLRSFDMVDGDSNRHNCDVLCAFKVYRYGHTNTMPDFRIHVRASGNETTANDYFFNVRFNTTPASSSITPWKIVSGTPSTLGSGTTKTLNEDTVYMLRVRANGTTTTTLSAKVWEYGTTEPGWDVTYADSSSPHTSAGWIGLNIGVSGTIYDAIAIVDWVSIGTAGNTAVDPTISPEEYITWLEDDTQQRCLLAHLTMANGSTGATEIKRLANRTFWTKTYDTPASGTPYDEGIVDGPSIDLTPSSKLYGAYGVSVGSLTLDNTDASRDAWALANVDGREAAILYGDPSWHELNFRSICRATMERIMPAGDDRLRVDLVDPRRLANNRIQRDPAQPLLYGRCEWVEPVCTDNATQEYIVTTGTLTEVGDLYDGGLALTASGSVSSMDAGADEIVTGAAHGLVANWEVVFDYTAGGITSGDTYYVVGTPSSSTRFQVSTTIGGSVLNITATGSGNFTAKGRSVEMSGGVPTGNIYMPSTPTYEYRFDYVIGRSVSDWGDPSLTEADYARMPHWVALDILTQHGAAGWVDDGALPALNSAAYLQGAPCGIWLTGSRNCLDIIDELAETGFWLYGPTRDGLIRPVYVLSTTSGSGFAIGEDDVIGGLTVEKIEMCGVSYGYFGKNWSPTRNPNPSAPADEAPPRALYTYTGNADSYQFLYASSTFDTDVVTNHDGAINYETRSIGYKSTTQVWSQNQMSSLRRTKAAHVSFTTTLRATQLDLGDYVTLTYPRYGFDAGKLGQVIGYRDDYAAQTVRLTLLVPGFNQAAIP